MEFSVRRPSPPNTYSYVREENLCPTRKFVQNYELFMCISNLILAIHTQSMNGYEEKFLQPTCGGCIFRQFTCKFTYLNQKNCFQGGKGAAAPIFGPRFFSTDLKRGQESLSPPKYLVPRRKLIADLPQFATIRRNLPQFAAIRRNLPQSIA
jgi:hypothetical protein